jgi:protein CpxP
MKTVIVSFVIMLGFIWLLFGFTGCQRSASAGPFGCGDGNVSAEQKVDFLKKRLISEFNLSASQAAELDDITADMAERHAEMRSGAHAFKAELIALMGQDQVSAADITNLLETRRPAMEDMMTLLAEKIADFHAILTPEQRAKLVAKMEAPHERRCRFGW